MLVDTVLCLVLWRFVVLYRAASHACSLGDCAVDSDSVPVTPKCGWAPVHASDWERFAA